jgi:hypothetical protein
LALALALGFAGLDAHPGCRIAADACGDDAAMVSESVEHGDGRLGVAEDPGPFAEVLVGDDDQAARFSSRMNRSIEGEVGQIAMRGAGRGQRVAR